MWSCRAGKAAITPTLFLLSGTIWKPGESNYSMINRVSFGQTTEKLGAGTLCRIG